MFKHHTSLKHALLSKLPNIHGTLPASVIVHALKPYVVDDPQIGTLIQRIMGVGISSSSDTFGRRGIAGRPGGGLGDDILLGGQ